MASTCPSGLGTRLNRLGSRLPTAGTAPPSTNRGGHSVAQSPVHVDWPAGSFWNAYSVMPSALVSSSQNVHGAVPTMLPPAAALPAGASLPGGGVGGVVA